MTIGQLSKANMHEIRETVEREIDSAPRGCRSVARAFLESGLLGHMFDLPWGNRLGGRLDLNEAGRARADHTGLLRT